MHNPPFDLDKVDPDLPTSEEDILKRLQAGYEETASHGIPATVDPDVADFMGAFEEDALDLEDAEESLIENWEEIEGEI